MSYRRVECIRLRDPRRPKARLFARELVQVYRGRLGVVIAMRAALGASGFKPFVEDKLTKIIDPFITGGNALEVILLAPREDGPAIRKWFNDMEGTPGSGRTGSGSAKEGN